MSRLEILRLGGRIYVDAICFEIPAAARMACLESKVASVDLSIFFPGGLAFSSAMERTPIS